MQDQIPHRILFPTQLFSFLPLRAFGCVCFVHYLSSRQDKALKCIFLGYSQLQKGYQCYSLELHRYLMSDVTFFEQQSFFLVAQPNLQCIDQVLLIPFYSPSLSLEDLSVSSFTNPPLLTYHCCPRPATGASPPTTLTHVDSLSPPDPWIWTQIVSLLPNAKVNGLLLILTLFIIF